MKSQTYDKHFNKLVKEADDKNSEDGFKRHKLSKSMNVRNGIYKSTLNKDMVDKFQYTTQTVKISKGTSSSSQSKFKNTAIELHNNEDILEELLDKNPNSQQNSPIDEKITSDERLMLNQTSELNYQLSQANIDNPNTTFNHNLKKNLPFQKNESTVMQGNIINQ